MRVASAAEPLAVRSCWCRDCQRIAAGGATTQLFFKTGDVTIDGALAWHEKVADSGTPLARAFCPACGTPVAVQSRARPHLIALRLGMMDDPARYPPQSVIWTSSAPEWACIDPALPQEPRQPAPVGC